MAAIGSTSVISSQQNNAEPKENVFMLRLLPYDIDKESQDPPVFLVVKISARPHEQWSKLQEGINEEVHGAIEDEDFNVPYDTEWQPDWDDFYVSWVDQDHWWTGMTRVSERNVDAVLEMMRQREHQDALSISCLYRLSPALKEKGKATEGKARES